MSFAVTAYFNETRGQRFEGYCPGEQPELVPSQLEALPMAHDTPEEAAEEVFAFLNHDYRPNGRTERSLSVGDLLRMERHDGVVFWLAVEGRGFRQVDGPVFTTA